jgi:hypothetical protein
MEVIDNNPNSLDAGQGLSGLPGSILQMTGNPLQVINPAALPVDPTTCKPIYPNQYLKVNTIFNVAHDHGLRTAWSDKHPAYQHGGNDPQDRNVPILVVLPGLENGHGVSAPVETTQIAPTILKLLGLNPSDLQAVQIEGTKVLPGLRGNGN